MNSQEPVVVNVDLNEEIDRWFDESSRSDVEFRPATGAAEMLRQDTLPAGVPVLLVIFGSPAAGKSRLRHERFQEGFVTVDAADIWRRLEGERVLDFPGDMEHVLDAIGQMVANRAVAERRRIVTEVFDIQQADAMFGAFQDIGYETHAIGLKLDDVEEAQRRNLNRGEHNISSYYTDPFNIRWLMEAAKPSE